MGKLIKQESWIVRNVGIIKLIGTLVIGGTIFMLSKYYWPTRSEILFKNVISLEFHGKVDSIYRDTENHNDMHAILSTGYVYGVYADWENKIEVGDSLSKERGGTLVYVFKRNGLKDTLDYKVLVRSWGK